MQLTNALLKSLQFIFLTKFYFKLRLLTIWRLIISKLKIIVNQLLSLVISLKFRKFNN